MADAPASGDRRRPRLLLYAMYAPVGLDSAPKVRIAMMGSALERIADVERVDGSRLGRMRAGIRWWRGGGFSRIDAVYVETSTTAVSPFDLVFLAWARRRGRRVGIYFRDAYAFFRDLYPRTRRPQWLGDLAWRASLPLLRRLASVPFAPTVGLAESLGLRSAVLLPPGTDPALPDLGVPDTHLAVAIVAPTPAAGFDRLRAAVELVRRDVPDARLRAVTSVPAGDRLPDWIELVPGGRPELARLLADARVCVVPLPLTRYTEIAVPVRLTDLLAFGKPVVVTDTAAMRDFLGSSEAALLVSDTPEALAEAIARVLRDDELAQGLSVRARAFAEAPTSTWNGRAAVVVASLLGAAT